MPFKYVGFSQIFIKKNIKNTIKINSQKIFIVKVF